jgi:general secretion pathway protein N
MIVRRRDWVVYALLGLVSYALFLLITLPAWWLDTVLSRASQGTLAIQQPQGTLWRGSGQLHVASGASQPLTRIDWRVQPQWLLMGRLRVELQTQGGGPAMRALVDAGISRLVVEKLDAALPATMLGQLYAPAAFFEPQGVVRLSSARLELASKTLNGDATAVWENASSRAWNLNQMGDYRLDLKGRGPQADLTLSTPRGDLRLTGQGTLTLGRNGAVRLQGIAEANPGRNDLEPVLNLLGPPDANGRRQFQFVYPR